MHKLSRPGLNLDDVATAEQLLTDHAAILGPTDLRRFAAAVVDAADPDGPEPVDGTSKAGSPPPSAPN
jgi:hypothetical protein